MLSEGALSSQYTPAVDVQPSRGAVGADVPFSRLHALIAPLTLGGLTVETLLAAAAYKLDFIGDHPAGELAHKLLGRVQEIEYRTQIALLTDRLNRSVERS